MPPASRLRGTGGDARPAVTTEVASDRMGAPLREAVDGIAADAAAAFSPERLWPPDSGAGTG